MKWSFAAILASMFIAIPVQAKKILVIESYHAEFSWDASYKEGLKTILGKKNTLVYFEMNTKRLPKNKHQKMADLAWNKYQQVKPDLVVLGDDAALKFLGKKFAHTATPVVYLGVNNNPRAYFKGGRVPPNITGVLERPLYKRSISAIKDLLPNAHRGLVLFDTDITSHIVLSDVFSDEKKQSVFGLEIDLELVEKYPRWRQLVASAKDTYDFIVVGLYQTLQDESGTVVNSDDVIAWTSKNTPVPVFGFWDFSVGSNKSIGGVVLYGKDMGIAAGKIAKKILSGISPDEIYIVNNAQGIFTYSKTQLKKWSITLPASIQRKATLTE